MSWNGVNEKKWEWYKHTKPCNNILNNGTCPTTNCNYAHTAIDYMNATLKRKFTLDPIIMYKLSVAAVPKNQYMNLEEDSVVESKKRSRESMDPSQELKKTRLNTHRYYTSNQ